MSILKTLREFFVKGEEIETKKENISSAIKPIFEEIAPEITKGEFLENLRSWGFIALSVIADEISTTKLRLLKKSGDGWEEIDNHPALTLIEKPNSFQTREELLWLETIYLGAEGEAPLLLDKGTAPTSMLLLRPKRLKPIFDSNQIIGEYKYGKSNGQNLTIPAEELLFLKYPSLLNPFRGQGYLSYIAKTLNLDTFTESYLNNFFWNSATPSGVLETDKELNASIVERIRHQWEKRHKGVQKAHKIAILEKGLKYNKTGFNLNDLMIDKMENKIRDKVLAAFKVPKSVLGIIEDVNRASSQVANNTFYRGAIRPRLRLLESQLNKTLLPKFPGAENMKFEFQDPVQEDEEVKAKIDDIYLKNGVLEINEVRDRLGLEPLESKEEPEPEKPEEEPEEESPSKAMTKVFKDIILRDQPKNVFTKDEINEYHKEKILLTDPLENKFKEKLVRYFEKINNRVLLSVKKKDIISEGDVRIDYELQGEAHTLAKISTPIIKETITAQSGLTFALMGIESQLTDRDEIVKKFIEKRSLLFATSVSKTTKKKLKRIMKDWHKKEESVSILRKRLTDYFGSAEKTRVDTIVRTEVSRAAGFATLETYKEAGAVGKRWVTAQDERVCPACMAMNNKVIPIDKNFWNKGETMGTSSEGINGKIDFKLEGVDSFPLHPKCRCDLVAVFEEKEIPKNPFGYKKTSERRLASRDRDLAKREELMFKEDEINKKDFELKNKDKKLDKEYKELLKANSMVKAKTEELEKKDQKVDKELKTIKKLWKGKKK